MHTPVCACRSYNPDLCAVAGPHRHNRLARSFSTRDRAQVGSDTLHGYAGLLPARNAHTQVNLMSPGFIYFRATRSTSRFVRHANKILEGITDDQRWINFALCSCGGGQGVSTACAQTTLSGLQTSSISSGQKWWPVA